LLPNSVDRKTVGGGADSCAVREGYVTHKNVNTQKSDSGQERIQWNRNVVFASNEDFGNTPSVLCEISDITSVKNHKTELSSKYTYKMFDQMYKLKGKVILCFK